LAAIPGVTIVDTPGAAQCCGAAGLYGLLQPELSQAVLAPKVTELVAAKPDVVATGNPGCVMQLGAALAADGRLGAPPPPVVHPVELLDRSYRLAPPPASA
jgi:glycolate oxidase iron-sulfur subunit